MREKKRDKEAVPVEGGPEYEEKGKMVYSRRGKVRKMTEDEGITTSDSSMVQKNDEPAVGN